MSKKTIIPVFAPQDEEKAQPILEALKARGIRSDAGKASKKNAVALLFLSAGFAADAAAQERFFALDSAGVPVIPVDLDGAQQPELVESAVIAKNAIAAAGRTSEEIAERVASAEAFKEKKSPLPKILIGLAVVLALGAAGWLLLPRMAEPPAPEETAAPVLSEREIAAAQSFGLTPEDLARITSFCIVGDKHGSTTTRFTTDSTVNPGLRVYLGDLADDREYKNRRLASTQVL